MAKQVAKKTEVQVPELKPTSGAAMREMREQGVVLPFPSGNVYRIRIVGAAHLLRRGMLPNILLAFVSDAIYHGVSVKKIDKFLSLREEEEHVLAFLDSLKIICEEEFLEPRVVEKPQADDEISIFDVPLIDQSWAFDLAFGVARELEPFRPEAEADVVVVPSAEELSTKTE